MNSAKAAGFSQGLEKGKADGKLEIAKAMLKEGLDLDIIIKLTGIPKEEIENLK